MIALIAGPSKPPRFAQGLGLPYLAAVLEKTGFKVKIFDRYPSSPDTDDPDALDQRLADVIAQNSPSIVGMTIHTPAYAERVRLAKYIRKRLSKALLIAGGHHPSAEPVKLLQNSDFDVCVIGEGERTLLEIAQSEKQETGDWLQDIQGVVYKQGSKIAHSQRRQPVADLDSLPFPANHLLGLEDYAPHPNLGIKSAGILTYRGCPMRCAFCYNPQSHWVRRHSPTRVVDEMTWVVKEFDVRGFNFYDNLFGLSREHALAVCEEIIKRKLDVVWECWTAGDLINIELAEKMREAGCIHVGFGAESGDDEVLIKTQRGFTSAQHQAGIHAIRGVGLKVEVFFMIGLPGESEESIRRTIEFAEHCGSDKVCLSLHRPYPGTAVWNHPKAFGMRLTHESNFEAYIETESLSRKEMLECAQQAGDELKRYGLMKDGFLRCDQYAWE